jgi:hypothetical protein
MGANPDKFLILAPKSSTEGNDCRKQESGLKKRGRSQTSGEQKIHKRPPPTLPSRVFRRKIRPPAGTTRGRRRFESRDRDSARSAPGEGQHCAEAPRRASAGAHAGPLTLSPPARSLETRELAATELFSCLCGCAPLSGVSRGVAWSVEGSVDVARAPGKAQ